MICEPAHVVSNMLMPHAATILTFTHPSHSLSSRCALFWAPVYADDVNTSPTWATFIASTGKTAKAAAQSGVDMSAYKTMMKNFDK